jgi:hypothetical protein
MLDYDLTNALVFFIRRSGTSTRKQGCLCVRPSVRPSVTSDKVHVCPIRVNVLLTLNRVNLDLLCLRWLPHRCHVKWSGLLRAHTAGWGAHTLVEGRIRWWRDAYAYLRGAYAGGRAHTPVGGAHTPAQGAHTPASEAHTPAQGAHTSAQGARTAAFGAHTASICYFRNWPIHLFKSERMRGFNPSCSCSYTSKTTRKQGMCWNWWIKGR